MLIENKKPKKNLSHDKKIASLVLFPLLLFLINCNGQGRKVNSNKNEEIFIGKTFFSGDELNNYFCEKSSDFSHVDSLSYSIYRYIGTKKYTLSIEKIIQNDDVTKYQIIDTVNFKNFDSINFLVTEINLENKIAIKAFQKKHLLKEWIFKKKENTEATEILNSKLKNYKIIKDSLNGLWRVDCRNGLTILDISGSDGYMSLYSNNAIYINVEIINIPNKNNEYFLRFKNTESQENYYPENKSIKDEEISKTENIAKLEFNNNNLSLYWYGLYNEKTNKTEFTQNDFVIIRENGGVNPVILNKCDE